MYKTRADRKSAYKLASNARTRARLTVGGRLVLGVLVLAILVPAVSIALSTARRSDRSYDWQNPRPQGNNLLDLAFPSADVGYAVGRSGVVLKTANAGGTWEALDIGSATHLNGAAFIDTNSGWVAGASGTIMRTTDGGSSWSGQLSGTSANLRDIAFQSASDGIAVGDAAGGNATIRYTKTGGLIWTGGSAPVSENLNAVSAPRSNLAWAVGEGGTMLTSSNGGQTWTAIAPLTNASLNAVQFAPGTSIGYAAGNSSGTTWNVFSTVDGVAWTRLTLPGTAQSILGIGVSDDGSRVTLVGAAGTVYRSDNGGATWMVQNPDRFSGVSFYAAAMRGTTVHVAGEAGAMLVSRDSGTRWLSEMQKTTYDILGSAFRDANIGYAVGTGGTVLRTTDAGATWTARSLGTFALRGASLADNNNLWVVGDNGRIMRSQTAGNVVLGESWSTFNTPAPTTAPLNDVYFASKDSGWAVGNAGTIVRITDGSKNTPVLQAVASPTIQPLNSVWFSDTSRGWAVGRNGVILRTTNGGVTWTAQNSNTTADLRDIWSADSSKAFAVGSGGVVLKTTNAGASWQVIATVGTTEDLHAVWGDNASKVWVGGAKGVVRRTFDAGVTWASQNAGLPSALGDGGPVSINTLFVRDASRAFVLGDRGEIRSTTNGGLKWTPAYVGTWGSLRSVASRGTSAAWAVGAAGTIVNTFDGQNWYRQTSNTTADLNDIAMPTNSIGWAVGGNGVIRRTVSAGWNWVSQNSGVTNQLNSVDSPNGINAVVVGNGVIRYRTNGVLPVAGAADSYANGSITGYSTIPVLNGVSMPVAGTAYAVADAGFSATVFKTTNGGGTWAPLTTVPNVTFSGVDFVDAQTGWIVGPGGRVYRTTNGGTSWTAQSSGVTNDLHSVSFSSALVGRVTGARGLVLSTTDGGVTWVRQDSGTASVDLLGVSAEGEKEGFVVGVNGAILRSYDVTRPTTLASYNPAIPNGLDGWYVTAPTIQLTPSAGATAYYSWASATGPWTQYANTLTAAEGISTLRFYSADSAGNQETVRSQQFKVDTIAPTALASLTATFTATTATLSWTGSTDAGSGMLGYDIYANGSLRASVSGTAATLEGLSPNTLYSIHVTASDVAGNDSAASNTVTFTTPDQVGASLGTSSTVSPAAPDGLNGWYTSAPTVAIEAIPPASEIPSVIYYSWTTDDPLAAGWSLYTGPVTAIPGANVLSYYASPTGPPSRPPLVNSRYLQLDPDTPSTPTGLAVAPVSQYALRASWNGVADTHSGISGYEVFVGGDLVATVPYDEEATGYEYEITGLEPLTGYSVRVRAVNGAGTASALTAAVSATTLAPPAAEPPTSIFAHAPTGDAVYVNWQYATDSSGDVSYKLWRSANGVDYSLVDTIEGRYNYTYVDVNRTSSTAYWYKVSTVDDRGESARSAATSATTPAPSRPGAVSAAYTDSTIALMWAPSENPGARGYLVYRSDSSLSLPTTLTAEPIAATMYLDMTAEPGRRYWYRVAVVDAAGATSARSVETAVEIPKRGDDDIASPHGSNAERYNECGGCHRSHSGQSPALTWSPGETTTETVRGNASNQGLCLSCHSGRTDNNVGAEYSSAGIRSRHPVETEDEEGTLYCGSCHASHRSKEATTDASLLDVNGVTSGNDVCYGCHGANAAADGRDFRVFENSAHASVAVGSDNGIACSSCHEQHASENEQLLRYSNWMVCMQCHVAETDPRMPDILHQVDSGTDLRTRHDITTKDQEINGARITCQNCHNTHVASGRYSLIDPDSPGVTGVWKDDIDSFCFRCHDGQLPTAEQTGEWVRPPLGPGGTSASADIQGAWNLNAHGYGDAVDPKLRPEMGYGQGTVMNCRTCHDGHGSVNAFTLRQDVYSADGSVRKDGLLVAPAPGGYDLRYFCNSCHDLTPAQHAPYANISTFPTDCTSCHRHMPTAGGADPTNF